MDLSCQICQDEYDAINRVPKILKCGHTICAQCIQSISKSAQKSSYIRCPFDKVLTKKKPAQIPKNFALIEIINQNCEKTKQEAQEPEDNNEMQCLKHSQEIKWICSVDKDLICDQCKEEHDQKHLL